MDSLGIPEGFLAESLKIPWEIPRDSLGNPVGFRKECLENPSGFLGNPVDSLGIPWGFTRGMGLPINSQFMHSSYQWPLKGGGEAVLRDNGYMLRTLAISLTGQTTTPWLTRTRSHRKLY